MRRQLLWAASLVLGWTSVARGYSPAIARCPTRTRTTAVSLQFGFGKKKEYSDKDKEQARPDKAESEPALVNSLASCLIITL